MQARSNKKVNLYPTASIMRGGNFIVVDGLNSKIAVSFLEALTDRLQKEGILVNETEKESKGGISREEFLDRYIKIYLDSPLRRSITKVEIDEAFTPFAIDVFRERYPNIPYVDRTYQSSAFILNDGRLVLVDGFISHENDKQITFTAAQEILKSYKFMLIPTVFPQQTGDIFRNQFADYSLIALDKPQVTIGLNLQPSKSPNTYVLSYDEKKANWNLSYTGHNMVITQVPLHKVDHLSHHLNENDAEEILNSPLSSAIKTLIVNYDYAKNLSHDGFENQPRYKFTLNAPYVERAVKILKSHFEGLRISDDRSQLEETPRLERSLSETNLAKHSSEPLEHSRPRSKTPNFFQPRPREEEQQQKSVKIKHGL